MKNIMKTVITLALAAAAFAAVPASAATAVYNTPNTTLGNQKWGGTLGLDFTVNAPVTVTALGAFAGTANLFANINVVIFDANGVAVSPTVDFAGTANPAGDAYLFKSITPFTLSVGSYQLASWGYVTGNGNYNPTTATPKDLVSKINFDSLGGRLIATGSRYGLPTNVGTLATLPDTSRYGSASFMAADAVPEPGTWAMLVVGFGVVGVAARRRNAAVAA